MIHAWYVEDEPHWQEIIQNVLTPYEIEVTAYDDGESLIHAIFTDVADQCEVVLIDWRLYEQDGQTRQPMQGGEIYEEVKRLKPYLPQFVVTQVDDLDEITNEIMSRHQFRHFFAKKWVQENNTKKIADFVNKIQSAVQEMKETLASLPQHASWDKYKPFYSALRFDDPHEWERIEKQIDDEVERLRKADFDAKSTLARRLPIVHRGEPLIKNVLIARRIIISELFLCGGRWHEVEVQLGYEEEPDKVYDNPYRIYRGAFRTYCCDALGIRPDELRNSGEGLLAEEVRWLQQYCHENNLTYGFPIA